MGARPETTPRTRLAEASVASGPCMTLPRRDTQPGGRRTGISGSAFQGHGRTLALTECLCSFSLLGNHGRRAWTRSTVMSTPLPWQEAVNGRRRSEQRAVFLTASRTFTRLGSIRPIGPAAARWAGSPLIPTGHIANRPLTRTLHDARDDPRAHGSVSGAD